MRILDNSSDGALLVDRSFPPSASTLTDALVAEWPRLEGRVVRHAGPIDTVALHEGDLVVSVHACGALTDQVIAAAVTAGARLAVLPCCHDLETADTSELTGWMPGPLAVDVTRAVRLRERGWKVWTQTIPQTITPQNRLLVAEKACSGPT
jgi:hypothetical protein